MNIGRVCMMRAISSVAVLTAAIVWGDVGEPPVEKPKAEIFAGTIRTLNIEKREMTVETTPISKTFGIASDCEVIARNKPKAALEDLTVGDTVNVTYQEEANGLLVAHRIEQKAPPKEAGTEERTESVRLAWRTCSSGNIW